MRRLLIFLIIALAFLVTMPLYSATDAGPLEAVLSADVVISEAVVAEKPIGGVALVAESITGNAFMFIMLFTVLSVAGFTYIKMTGQDGFFHLARDEPA